MKLAYSTWGMQNTPIETAVRHCAALGFDGLELTCIPRWPTDAAILSPADRRRILELYDENGIELCGLSGNVNLLGPDWDSVRAAFCSYLDLAAELQLPGERLIVTTTTGGSPEDWDERRNDIIERLGVLTDYAAAHGVMVGIEPHVGSALRLPDDVLWLVGQVNSADALTVHFDISHFNVQGLAMDEVIRQLAPHSLHTHVKDERGLAPDHEFLIPGEGEMDYVGYLRGMQAAGYDGHIVVEISLMVQQRPDYDALAAATQSYEVLNRAFVEAGMR